MTTEQIDRLRTHFTALCNDYNVKLCTTCKTTFKDNCANVDAKNNVDHRICVAPITGPVSYAAAMHELGHTRHALAVASSSGEYSSRYKLLMDHIAGGGSDLKMRLTTWDLDLLVVCELSAWEWAVRHSLFWTSEMARCYRYAVGSYLNEYEVLKEQLPKADAMDAKFQRCTPKEAMTILKDELMKLITPDMLLDMLKGLTDTERKAA